MLLVCHAEGLQNRYSDLLREPRGAGDGGLTAFGWEQTNLLAQWLTTHEQIDALYTAPLLRSRLTAQRLGQVLNLPVTVLDEMPGHFPPSTVIPNAWDRNTRSIKQRVAATEVDAASLYGDYLHHLLNGLDHIVSDQWGKTVLIVLSGNGVATAVRHFSGSHSLAVAVVHTGITELRRQDGLWYLVYANRREHMPEPLSEIPRPKVELVPVGNGRHADDLAAVADVYNRLSPERVQPGDHQKNERMQHLLKFAQIKPGSSVLDLGTGTGLLALQLAESGAGEVVGIDISPVMLEVAEYLRLSSTSPSAQRVSYRLAPAHALPFRDERFDAIVCRLLLHHSHHPQEILAELVRLLKHGGELILADLLSADDPVKRATQNAIEERRNPSHVAAYTTDQYRKFVTGAGLVIEDEQVVVFERELEEWLNDMQADQGVRTIVREMVEAGLETDAAGLNVRRRNNELYFDQRLVYLKAVKA